MMMVSMPSLVKIKVSTASDDGGAVAVHLEERDEEVENTVHLTDTFLQIDRGLKFANDKSSRGTTFAALSVKGVGRKEREDTFAVSIFDARKLNSNLSFSSFSNNNDNDNSNNGTFRSLEDVVENNNVSVLDKQRIGMFCVIDGHGGNGAAAFTAANLNEFIFEKLSYLCANYAKKEDLARGKLMKIKMRRQSSATATAATGPAATIIEPPAAAVQTTKTTPAEQQSSEEEEEGEEGEEYGGIINVLVKEAIREGFKQCDEDFLMRNKKDKSGCCVALALCWNGNLWIAHVGDCKIIAAEFYCSEDEEEEEREKEKELEIVAETLTIDHVASNSSEANAVISRGGFIRDASAHSGQGGFLVNIFNKTCSGLLGRQKSSQINNLESRTQQQQQQQQFCVGSRRFCDGIARVNGELAVTRSIGDRQHKPHVSSVPVVQKTRFRRRENRSSSSKDFISKEKDAEMRRKETFLMLTTDGAFGCGRVSDQEAATVVARCLQKESTSQSQCLSPASSWSHKARKACSEVISNVKAKGGKDDATLIVIDVESIFERALF